MKILFVQTGGTIDKDYPKTTNGWGFEIGEPAFRRLLEERLSPSFEYEVLIVSQKDSTEITDSDRCALATKIQLRLEKAGLAGGIVFDGVVVTHGTDTMAETAEYLGMIFSMHREQREQLSGVKNCYHLTRSMVPIVLTGAMRPERFSNSDADCNLGMAIAAVQTVPLGFIGICMHGLVLSHEVTDRDPHTGKFVRKGSTKTITEQSLTGSSRPSPPDSNIASQPFQKARKTK
jgi:L-asparaginase